MSEEKKYPEVVVGTLIVNKNNKLLFCRSKKWRNKYTVFGGHIEYKEKMEETAIREAKEETGLDVSVIAKIGTSEYIMNPEFYEKKHFVFFDYLCKYDGGDDDIIINDEFDNDYKWVTVEDAKKLDLASGAKLILKEYIEYLEGKDYLDNWKRCQADLENYKKDQSRRMEEFRRFTKIDFVMQILPVLDNFHASIDHIPEDQKKSPWVEGIMHIQKQLENVLKDNGVEEIETKAGDEFNPEIHEAMQGDTKETKNDTKETNKIIKIVRKGYKIGDRVIRAAKVIVN